MPINRIPITIFLQAMHFLVHSLLYTNPTVNVTELDEILNCIL